MDVPSTSAFTPSLPALAGSPPATVSTPSSGSGEGTLAGIAEHLGMSTDTVQQALRDGQSIASLAEQQGVPRDSVGTLIGTQIQRARLYTGQPPLDQDALDRMVERALDRGRPAGGGAAGGPAAGGPARGAAASPESLALATYASNARVAAVAEPAGGTISLLV